MSNHLLAIPDNIYQRASRLAEERSTSAENILLHHLQQFTLPRLEPDIEEELRALHSLSNAALVNIAKERMDDDTDTTMQALMDKNNFGILKKEESATLETLVDQAQRLMLRKSEARAILALRNTDNTS